MPKSRYRQTVQIRPLEHIYDISKAPMNQPQVAASWPSMNIMLGEHQAIVPRPGYATSETLSSGDEVQRITWFKKRDATEYTIYLTKQDIAVKQTGANLTYKFHTPQYSTGTVTTVKDSKTVTGASTAWVTGGVAADDKFIVVADYDDDAEPDTHWGTIATVDSGGTSLTLDDYYGVTNVAGSTYKIRKVYSVPANERWSYCVSQNKFIFANGNEWPQYWDGTSSMAAQLERTLTADEIAAGATYRTNKARYVIPYAERLLVADYYESTGATRYPWNLAWSDADDVTFYNTVNAGEITFAETEGFITGLGLVGSDIIVYKDRSLIFGSRTGVNTAPFEFSMEKRGIGCWAPYSLVHAMSTNFFLGPDDFYVINGDHPESIGKKIRGKFFNIVPVGERQKVFGWWSRNLHMIIWVANTSTQGQLFFGYDYINMEWMTWKFHTHITGVGDEG